MSGLIPGNCIVNTGINKEIVLRVLVTGANGFIGAALCRALVLQGHAVRGAVRTPESASAMGKDSLEVVVVGNIDVKTEWSMALQGIDVVIHLAARVHVMREYADDPLLAFRSTNVGGTERLARSAAACGVKRLVYVSSIKVNGEGTADGQKYGESDLPAPQDAYGISKYEAEQALHRVAQETGLEIVVVRPPLVYGPGVRGNFLQMLKVLARGGALPLASIRNRRSLLYLGNLVDALVLCVTQPAAAGQTYLVSDGEDISTPELLRSLADAAGLPLRLFPCPATLLMWLARLAGKRAQAERLLGSLQVENGKIRRELNWKPPYTLQQGLQATAEWYRTSHT
jgi:nucleoside-diphosphate-sugar epimerase